MSFALTERQLLDGTKTVTRRLGWRNLNTGTELVAVRKAMGLRRGESAVRLAVIRVVDVQVELLHAITQEDVIAEGFPWLEPDGFVTMFCKHMGCSPDTEVTRICFELREILELTQAEKRKWAGARKGIATVAAKQAPLLAYAGLLPEPPNVAELAARAARRKAAYEREMAALRAADDEARATVFAEAEAVGPDCLDFVRGHREHPLPPYYYAHMLGRWQTERAACLADLRWIRDRWRGHLLTLLRWRAAA